MTEILLAKLMPPRAGKEIIDRPRLIKLLGGFEERKLTLLQAPAGYGKTVLMLQLANAAKRALVWYQLDAYDNDPVVFWQYLITGIRRQIPEFGIQVQQLIEEGGIENRLRLMVTTIVNGLSQQADRPLLLVFDDYQAISEPLLHRFMQDFLEHLPAYAHVMIASRVLLPLDLSRLKTAGEVLSIGTEELHFTVEETKTFLIKKAPDLSTQAQEFVEQKINGWPAAVKLIADAASNTDISLQINSGTAEIYKYLANNVLEQQPENAKELLLKTAVFDVITAADCDLLLKRDDSAQILDSLEKRNLLLIPLTGNTKSYRYHQLFRDFLLEKLGEECKVWQREAGIIAQNRGDIAAAVEYFQAAGAQDNLLAILKDAGRQAFSQGRWQTVARWLEPITQNKINEDPWLALFRAKVEVYRGKKELANAWVERSATLFTALKDRLGLAETQILQARLLRYRGFYHRSLELLEEASPYIQQEERKLRFEIPIEQAFNLILACRLPEAEIVLKRVIPIAGQESEDNYTMTHLLECLGCLYYFQGRLTQAMQVYHRAMELSPEQILPNYYYQDFVGAIYNEWGESDKAYEYVTRNIARKENFGLSESLHSAYYQLADIYLYRSDFIKAEENYRRSIGLLEDNGEDYVSLIISYSLLARCLGWQGRLVEAQSLIEEALSKAQGLGGLALAVCQGIAAAIYLDLGRKQEAAQLLFISTKAFEEIGYLRSLILAYASMSHFHSGMGDQIAAGDYAQKTLELAAKNNFVQYFLLFNNVSQPLLQYGMEHGVAVTFVQKILSRVGKRAIPLLSKLSEHPNPEVRRRVITPLAEISGNQALALIQKLVADHDPEIRELTGMMLQRLDWSASSQPYPQTARDVLGINTLGSFQLIAGGNEICSINWRTTKTRDLLAFLVHQRNPVSKETILEDLWPDYDFDKAQGLLHTSLYYLRQVLEKIGYPDLVNYKNKHYQLAPNLFVTDRNKFQELVAAGFNDETPPDKCYEFLERALSLYHGDYLHELDYVWLLPDREYLKNIYFEARLRLARYYLERTDYNRAISHLQLLVGLDSWSEEIHRLLMAAYAGLGNRSAIREQYQALTLILKNELGLEPSPETRAVYQRLYQAD
jgi:ATP/maltotriose-dependent transcriptional regulator MalT/DNA-binding SARP family transcriptional activator